MRLTDLTLDDIRSLDLPFDGLVLRGCGGNPKEWLDGINDLLLEEKIIKKPFESLIRFDINGLTCLVYDLSEAEPNISKLAMWRINTAENFAGVWLSDLKDWLNND